MQAGVQKLPPTLVPYLNALSHKASDHTLEREEFEAGLESIEFWLEFQSGYSLDEEEQTGFDNIAHLLVEVRSALNLPGKQQQLDRLVPDLYRLVACMEQITRRREAPHRSPQPAVNDFLLCGLAWLQGRASQEAVLSRAQRLEGYFRVLRQAFQGVKSRLHSEVVTALDAGFGHLRGALPQITQALSSGDQEAFQDGLASLSEGAEIMQHLIDWQRQDEVRFAQTHHRYFLLGVGASFELALEQARQLPRPQWRKGLRYLREEQLPRLTQNWERLRWQVFWEPNQRLERWAQVEEWLEEVGAILDDLSNPEFDGQRGLDELESALGQLSDCLLEGRRTAVRADHLEGTQPGLYLEAIAASLEGACPFLALPELFHSSPPPQEWKPIIDQLVLYGEDLEPDHLFRAAYLLGQLFPPPEMVEGSCADWTCPYCGQLNSSQRKRCQRCQGQPSSLASTAWSG